MLKNELFCYYLTNYWNISRILLNWLCELHHLSLFSWPIKKTTNTVRCLAVKPNILSRALNSASETHMQIVNAHPAIGCRGRNPPRSSACEMLASTAQGQSGRGGGAIDFNSPGGCGKKFGRTICFQRILFLVDASIWNLWLKMLRWMLALWIMGHSNNPCR